MSNTAINPEANKDTNSRSIMPQDTVGQTEAAATEKQGANMPKTENVQTKAGQSLRRSRKNRITL